MSQALDDLKGAVVAVGDFVNKLKADKVVMQSALDKADADLAQRDADLAAVTKQLQDLVAAG